MAPGIRATVEFSSRDLCPVVELSATTGTTVDTVSRTACGDEGGECVTEFAVETDDEPDTDLSPVFSHGSTHRYRFPHDDGRECPCELLGQFECPVTRYVAREGDLTLVFHAADYDRLQTIVGRLRDEYPEMNIKRFVRGTPGDQSHQSVLVDRSKLTARQYEILETAYEMGYFERPRQANATEIAEKLDISPATFSEHLAVAQRKLLDDIV